jgi:hypothetical protein
MILSGAFNKVLAQARGDSFLDLLCLFRARLRRAGHLVLSGYGFGDKGINSVILEWLSHEEKGLMWIDPEPGRTLQLGRPAMQALTRGIGRKQVTVVASGFQQVSWDAVEYWLSQANDEPGIEKGRTE